MTLGVFLLVLLSGLVHASWNALIKTGADKVSATMMLSVGHAVFALPVIALNPLPPAQVWPWILGSGLLHVLYQLFLAMAYHYGDLSRVYPIARGLAPMLVLGAGLFLLPDDLMSPAELGGILLVGLGIMLMVRGVFSSSESLRLLPFALGTAVATACYSLVDGVGARISGNPVSYVAWVAFVSGGMFVVFMSGRRGLFGFGGGIRMWAKGLLAGGLSLSAYGIVVYAMAIAPIALVAALRETSILFAVLLGAVFFGERLDAGKLAAAALIVLGIALTRF